MPTRSADAGWNGPLADGAGTMRFGSGAFEGPSTFRSRFVDEAGRTGPDPEDFQRIADGTRQNCPVSRLLTGAPITLEARLL